MAIILFHAQLSTLISFNFLAKFTFYFLIVVFLVSSRVEVMHHFYYINK